MEEIQKHGEIGLAAMRAGMDRKTARKYVRAGKLPSELRKPHTWRTREDPFAEDWPALAAMLEEAPELEARTLFEHWWTEKRLGTYDRRAAADAAASGPGVAGTAWARARDVLSAGTPPGRGDADRLHARDGAGGDDRRRAVRAPALPQRAAVLELGVGDGVSLGVDGGAAARGAIDAVSARARPDVPSDGQLDGGDP